MDRDVDFDTWYHIRYESEDFTHDYGYWLFMERICGFDVFQHPHNGAYLHAPVEDDCWKIDKR